MMDWWLLKVLVFRNKVKSDYNKNSGENDGGTATPFTGRHKPIHGGLTVPIQGTDTREKGGHNPSLRANLRFSGKQ